MFVDEETAVGGAAMVGASTGLAGALDGLGRAVDGLAGVDLAGESDEELLDALGQFERLSSRVAAQQLRVVAACQRRESYAAHGAVTMASWYRHHARIDYGEATGRVQAAARLAQFPLFAAALAAGRVSPAHVTALTRAAVPDRAAAVAAHEDTLVRLAEAAPPQYLRVALRRIADHADRDGSDPDQPRDEPAGCGRDPRREFTVRSLFDGLGEVRGWLDQVDTELLLTLLDALDQPDPEGTPKPRSPAQRRADAFGRLLRLVADTGVAPTVQGVKPHLLLTVDLARLLGVPPDHPRAADLADLLSRLLAGNNTDPDALANLLAAIRNAQDNSGPGDSDPSDRDDVPPATADAVDTAAAADGPAPAGDSDPGDSGPYSSGPGDNGPGDSGPGDSGPGDSGQAPNGGPDFSDLLDPDPAATAGQPRLRRTGALDPDTARCVALDAKITAVLTMGPWRIVNVGRTMRTLPAWLRPMLEMTHRHCRGPYCDRPATWTEAHHVKPWTEHGDTDLNRTVPLCKAHHQHVSSGRWQLDYNPGNGTCTWTGPQGQIHTTRPPP